MSPRGITYYIVAYGVELLLELYGRLPQWRATDFSNSVRVIAVSRATATLAADSFPLATPPAVVNPSVGPCPAAADVRRGQPICDGAGARSRKRGTGPADRRQAGSRKGRDLVMRSVADLQRSLPGPR